MEEYVHKEFKDIKFMIIKCQDRTVRNTITQIICRTINILIKFHDLKLNIEDNKTQCKEYEVLLEKKNEESVQL